MTNDLGRILFVICTLGAGAAIPLLASSGCGATRCTPGSNDFSKPASSIECPGGSVCYQGECVETCNAGGESKNQDNLCESDSDCNQGRPFCNEGFCSACEQGTACIPQLNICQRKVAPQTDGGGTDARAGTDGWFAPLDSGPFDVPRLPGIDASFAVDAGFIPITHRGEVTVSAITENNALRSEVTADVVDLEASLELTPATLIDGTDDGNCELWAYPRYSGGVTVGANLGNIKVEATQIPQPPNIIGSGISGTGLVELEFNGAFYDVKSPVPLQNDVLIFSQYAAQLLFSELTVSGTGSVITGGKAWPVTVGGELPVHRVPLEVCGETSNDPTAPSCGCGFCLDYPTTQTLRATVDGSQTQFFRFRAPGTETNWNPTDLLKTEALVQGQFHYLRCGAAGDMSGEVLLPQRLLCEFSRAETATSSGTAGQADLYLQRIYRGRLEMPVNAGDEDAGVPPKRADVRVNVRHAWKTNISFGGFPANVNCDAL